MNSLDPESIIESFDVNTNLSLDVTTARNDRKRKRDFPSGVSIKYVIILFIK